MPVVNYVREHIRFMEYAADEHLSSSERLVWYALMHVMNQHAQRNVWPGEFIRISNERLLSLCPLKFDSLANARNGLKQRGLIEMIPGEKNKKSPAYRMIYFYPQNIDDQSYTEKPDNDGYKAGDNAGDKLGYNVGYSYINNTYTGTERNLTVNHDDEDTGVIYKGAGHQTASALGLHRQMLDRAKQKPGFQRAVNELKAAWQNYLGTFSLTDAVADETTFLIYSDELEDGEITDAVRLAAIYGASNPAPYIIKVISKNRWAKRLEESEDANAG